MIATPWASLPVKADKKAIPWPKTLWLTLIKYLLLTIKKQLKYGQEKVCEAFHEGCQVKEDCYLAVG